MEKRTYILFSPPINTSDCLHQTNRTTYVPMCEVSCVELYNRSPPSRDNIQHGRAKLKYKHHTHMSQLNWLKSYVAYIPRQAKAIKIERRRTITRDAGHTREAQLLYLYGQ